MHLVLDLLQVAKGRQRRFVYGRSRLEVYVLSEQAKANTAGANQVATIGSLFAAKQAKDRRLAGAIAANKSYVLARINL
jgi:hypothetical protein